MFLIKIINRLKGDTFNQFFARIALQFLLLYVKLKFDFWILIFRIRNKWKKLYRKKIGESIMLLDITDKGISRELIYAGIREAYSTQFLKTFLNAGDICVDIGANIGYYALQEARLIGKDGKVFAVEPSSENFKALKKNIALNNYETITSFHRAIGSDNHTGYLNLSKKSNLHSIADDTLDSLGEKEHIEIMTLDAFLKDKPYPQFIRMDVEGYEEKIISGMSGVLEEKKPLKMFIELHCHLLEDGGYKLLSRLRDANFTIKALFSERPSILKKESNRVIALYDYFFLKRGSVFDNSLTNYDIPIDELLPYLKSLKQNAFEVFLVRE